MKKSFFLFSILLIMSLFLLAACSPLSNEGMDNNAKEYINAFINSDVEKLKDLTHPDYVDDIDKLEQFKQELKDNGIELKGEISKLNPYSRSITGYDSAYDGSINNSKYNLTVGEDNFDVTLVVLKTKNGSGVCDFKIEPD